MANDYYTHTTFPVEHTTATASGMRAELDAVEQGFDKAPPLTTHKTQLVFVDPASTGSTAASTLSFAGTTLTLDGELSGTGLTITSPTIPTPTLTTPTFATSAMTGAVLTSPTLTSPTMTAPVITGDTTTTTGNLLGPRTIQLTGTGGGTDENVAQFIQSAGTFTANILNDSKAGAVPFMTITRSGMTPLVTNFPVGVVKSGGVAIDSMQVFEAVISNALANTEYNFSHGQASRPREVWGVLRCVTASHGFAVGDELDFALIADAGFSNTLGPCVYADATYVGHKSRDGYRAKFKTGSSGAQLFSHTLTTFDVVIKYRV